MKYLKEKGWVRQTDDGVAITATGRLALQNYRRFARSMEAVDELEEFLSWMSPSDAEHLDMEALRGSYVVTPTQLQPMTPVERLGDLLDGAERVRAILPHVLPSIKEAVERELAEGLEMDVVLSEELNDLLRSKAGELTERFDARFYVLEEDVPFGLRIVDGTLTLLAQDEDGLPRALVVNDSPEALEWGERRFEAALSRAEEL